MSTLCTIDKIFMWEFKRMAFPRCSCPGLIVLAQKNGVCMLEVIAIMYIKLLGMLIVKSLIPFPYCITEKLFRADIGGERLELRGVQ